MLTKTAGRTWNDNGHLFVPIRGSLLDIPRFFRGPSELFEHDDDSKSDRALRCQLVSYLYECCDYDTGCCLCLSFQQQRLSKIM